jgi:hypothetical protein
MAAREDQDRLEMTMRLPVLAFISSAVLLAVAAPAGAAPIRECGNHGWVDDLERVAWVMDRDRISGAGTFNVTSRKVTCKVARRVSLKSYPGSNYRGWRCRYISQAHEYADVRCTRPSGAVVRWQTAA